MPGWRKYPGPVPENLVAVALPPPRLRPVVLRRTNPERGLSDEVESPHGPEKGLGRPDVSRRPMGPLLPQAFFDLINQDSSHDTRLSAGHARHPGFRRGACCGHEYERAGALAACPSSGSSKFLW